MTQTPNVQAVSLGFSQWTIHLSGNAKDTWNDECTRTASDPRGSVSPDQTLRTKVWKIFSIHQNDRGLTACSSIEDHNDAWDNLWESDNSDMWDRGRPSPALIDLLEQREDILSPIAANGQRKKILVPVRGPLFYFSKNQEIDSV